MKNLFRRQLISSMRREVGLFLLSFFFQAEDGIRDGTVTGVQTCALPIYAGLKVISLALAIALWRVVSRDQAAEMELRVPIVFRNFPANLEIDSASFTEAQVRVRGPGRLIHRLRATDVRAEIDLATVRPGSRTFDLTSRNVRVPQDLEVVQIIPSQFQLSFDDRKIRSVEVHPRVTGTFAEG